MTLLGIGIDIVSIARIGAILDRYGARFEQRWFDSAELTIGLSRQVALARSFAVKEAVVKALPHYSGGRLPWRDIVAVARGEVDEMDVKLEGGLAREATADHVGPITATATVRGGVVIAAALVERLGPADQADAMNNGQPCGISGTSPTNTGGSCR
ncbi:MAG: 4'-phosphopantetheinyl transferase superfamily protein [Microlunatus sp.]|nr:4'-phosphopantetheinyl transferase superfamily protein [Microlunatus sp.]